MHHVILAAVIVAATVSVAGGGNSVRQLASPDAPAAVIQTYKDGLSRVCTASPDVHLSVGRDPMLPDPLVMFVEYPAPTGDPAARDVRCDAEDRDWTRGRAISFQVKPANPLRLSVSFLDRNGVAYTAWADLQGGVWQAVRVPFTEIRPNPYFQPPGAKSGVPLDVSDVKWIAFAPQDQAAGRLAISGFLVLR
jgi:Carbohydrate binding domain (family 11)